MSCYQQYRMRCLCNTSFCLSLINLVILISMLLIQLTVIDTPKSTINSVYVSTSQLTPGSLFPFTTDTKVNGSGIKHEGETNFVIQKAGIYYVSFHTSGYVRTPISTEGIDQISVELDVNQNTIEGSKIAESITNTYHQATLQFGVLIEAKVGDVIRVKNTSTNQETVFLNSNITIMQAE